MLYYREDLEGRACACAVCRRAMRTHDVYYHSACHANVPLWVRYRGGVLTIECATCQREVMSVVVASWNDELHVRRRHDHDEERPSDEERCP